ncbi:MAG: T9SS type A sorting domain-containing protein [Bacteroidetes bacterium]|nr:T9SS type A sorting domain-containing protein [Bacteroidota bacterium]
MNIRPYLASILLMIVSAISAPLANAQSTYFPTNIGTWETITPQSLGWCSSNIDSLYNYLNQKNTKAFLILKDGKIVLEKYFGSFTQDSVWYWASAGKTLTAFTVGLAKQDGLLKLNDPSNKYLGAGWSSLSTAREDSITVWHHLTMTTGLDDVGADPDCTDPNCLTYKAAAGTRWAYHNAPYTLIDQVIEGATGGNLNIYMAKKFTNTVGMKGLFVKAGYNNVYFSTARTMARFGLLLLNKGTWNGTVIMSDTLYFRQQTNSSQALNPSYGYLTWLNGKSAFMAPGSQIRFPGNLNPDAPNDMICAWGKNGQFINVVPSQKLVLIRMGNAPGGGGAVAMAVGFNNDIWKYVNKLPCSTTTQTIVASASHIYPNPARIGGTINIEFNKASSVKSTAQSSAHSTAENHPSLAPQLLDITGRLVATLNAIAPESNTYSLPSTLNAGIYFLRFYHQGNTREQRLIIE